MLLRQAKPTPPGLTEAPLLSGGLPLVGHTVEFVRSTIGLLERAHREHGEVAAIDVAGRRMVALFGPTAHEAVFRAKDAVLDPREAYKIMTPVFGEGMVYDAPHDVMAEQFKMLLPALKDARMRTYGETILEEVQESIAGWGDEGELDVVDYCRVLTNFTSSHCLLGAEFRKGMTDEFARIYHDLERGVTPLAYINAHLPIPAFRQRDRARARLVELIGGIIDARVASGRTGEDFLQTLMEARYSNGRALTHDEITGMLLAAMFAGHHTSSVTTAWTLVELCRHPAYLRRVIEELDGTYGEDGTTSYATLRSIPVTENAVKEALRLYPPLFMLIRVAMQDFSYGGHHLPKGTWLLVSPTVAHRMPEHFAHPLAFDPDRFAPPRSEDANAWAFIAFGGGRHKCMGNAFALLQVKAILATLLRRYELELVTEDVRPDFHGLVIGPSEPCRLRYRRRALARASVTVPQALTPTPQTLPDPSPEPAAPQASLRITLDKDLCQGHAVCVGEAPEVFTLGDDGKVALLTDRPDPQHHAAVRAAARYCPQRTIVLHEAPAAASACPFH
ncbi:MAG: cytochrome P450 [Sandaracinaceae bacterium]|nr:cytochrome P450 [Sandaracinaceae bacterium]